MNSVAPGLIETDIWRESLAEIDGLRQTLEAGVSLRRWGQPDDIADVVAWLASDQSSYVTGETIAADGGMTRVRGGGTPEFRAPTDA